MILFNPPLYRRPYRRRQCGVCDTGSVETAGLAAGYEKDGLPEKRLSICCRRGSLHLRLVYYV